MTRKNKVYNLPITEEELMEVINALAFSEQLLKSILMQRAEEIATKDDEKKMQALSACTALHKRLAALVKIGVPPTNTPQ